MIYPEGTSRWGFSLNGELFFDGVLVNPSDKCQSMLCSNVKDINGREIYEFDRVEFEYSYKRRAKVAFRDGMFFFTISRSKWILNEEIVKECKMVVNGNVFEKKWI